MFQWLRKAQSRQVAKERLQRIMPAVPVQVEESPSAGALQIEVNLLPAEYVPESLFSIRNISFLVLSLLILAFLAFDVMQIIEREKALSLQNQQMLQVLNNYRQLKQEIDKLKERTALLRQRRDLIVSAIGERDTWSDKLSQIYRQVPESVWLSEIAMKREFVSSAPTAPPAKDNKSKDAPLQPVTKEAIRLHISGDAKDISYIAEFIDLLEAVPFLGKTRLNSVNQREEEKREIMAFEIVSQVHRGKS
jgi:Tfp pilus assembly protein PilN